MKKFIISLLVEILFHSIYANIIYVKQDAVGLNNGTSWNNAYVNFQSATSIATIGDTIVVSKGTYKTSNKTSYFTLVNKVVIIGSFAGNEAVINAQSIANRDITGNATILSGDINGDDNGTLSIDEPTRSDNSYHVIYYNQTTDSLTAGTVFDGFKITGGQANGSGNDALGGGMSLASKSVKVEIRNVIIEHNVAKDGGGIEVGTVSNGAVNLSFNNVLFESNMALDQGASVRATGGAININSNNNGVNHILSFTNVIFENNTSWGSNTSSGMGDGGAIFGYCNGTGAACELLFDSVQFKSNKSISNGSSSTGGAISLEADNGGAYNLTVKNSMFCENSLEATAGWATDGAAVSLQEGYYDLGKINASFTNVTFTANTSGFGSALHLYQDSVKVNLINTLIYKNTISADNSATYTQSHCLIGATDPRFCDASNFDLRLKTGSPALNAGDSINGPNIGYYQGAGIDIMHVTSLSGTMLLNKTALQIPSDEKSFSFEAYNVKDSLEIIAPQQYNLRLSTDGWENATNKLVFYPDTDKNVPYTLCYIRYIPITEGKVNDSLVFNSTNGTFYRLVNAEGLKNKSTYVNFAATGADNGTSWTDAYKKLYVALDSSLLGDTIYVARGTYYPDTTDQHKKLSVKKEVKLFGGFVGNETNINTTTLNNRNFINNETILSGDINKDSIATGNSYEVVYAEGGGNNTIIDGFTISGGNNIISNVNYSGLYCAGNATLKNLVIKKNRGYTLAGGLYLQNGTYILDSVQFIENNVVGSITTCYGGGLYADNSTVTIKNCVFWDNEVKKFDNVVGLVVYGGGIYSLNSNISLINCSFYNNRLILDNGAKYTNHVYINGGSFTSINTIFHDGGVIRNSGTFDLSYSYCHGTLPTGTTDNGNNVFSTSGAGFKNVRYANPDSGDFRLYDDSPCLNKGNNTFGNNIGYYQGAGLPAPNINISDTLLDFGNVTLGFPSIEQSFTVSGANLTGTVTINAPDGFQLTTTSGNYSGNTTTINLSPISGVLDNSIIYARLFPLTVGNYTKTIMVTSPGASYKLLSVDGNCLDMPSISVFDSEFNFNSVTIGTTSFSQNSYVNSINLVDTIKVTAPKGFLVSNVYSGIENFKDSIWVLPVNNDFSGYLYVLFNPQEVKTYSDSIKITTKNIPSDVFIKVTGTGVTGPAISVNRSSIPFGEVFIGDQKEDSILVAGYNLSIGDLLITVSFPFQISLTKGNYTGNTSEIILPQVTGTIQPTMIYILFTPVSEIDYNQQIMFESFGVDTKYVDLYGKGSGQTTVRIPNHVAEQIKIYPIPAIGYIRVEFPGSFSADKIIEIVDLKGSKKQVKMVQFENGVEIDLKNLNQGLYFIVITDNSKRTTLPFLKF